MGGFAFDASSMSPEHKRLTVSPSGIKLLTEIGITPEISLESIEDKSKADVLAKVLVICQTLWLVLQCIGRKLNSLPISILEVHTVVHVVCALGMYAFWFNKPLEVHDTMILNGGEYEEILAYMMMVSPGLGLVGTNAPSAELPESALLSFDHGLADKGKSTATNSTAVNNATTSYSSRGHKYRDGKSVPRPASARDLDADFISSRPGFPAPRISLHNGISDSESGFSWKEVLSTKPPKRSSTWSHRLLRRGHTAGESEEHKMAREDVQRWRLASRAICKHPWLEAKARFGIGTQDIVPIQGSRISEDDYIDRRIEDRVQALIQVSRPNFDFPFSDEAHQAFYNPILMVFPIIYGALHFAAYNFTFPTKAEDALWYFSSLYIMGSSWLILMIFKPSLTIALVIFGIPYVFSRFFLVVEAFISLRGADVGIYRTVIWAELIPHF